MMVKAVVLNNPPAAWNVQGSKEERSNVVVQASGSHLSLFSPIAFLFILLLFNGQHSP